MSSKCTVTKKIESILELVRNTNSFWHRTSVNNLERMFESGNIIPNIGQFQETFDQSKTSLARHLKSISLFDFDTCTKKQILDQSLNWLPFFNDQGVATILIRINKTSLIKNSLIFPSEIDCRDQLVVHTDGSTYYPTRIPFVEVLYSQKIPIEYIEDLYIIKRGPIFENIHLKRTERALEEVRELELQWNEKEKEEKLKILSKHPNSTLAEMFENPLLYNLLLKNDD